MDSVTAFFQTLAATDNVLAMAVTNTILIPVVILVIGLVFNTIARIITSLIALIFGARPANTFRNYVTYPGTIIHELSHALFAAITGAKVKKITLRPKGNTLGSVDFIPRGNFITKGIQMTVTSIAPVFSGLFFLWLIVEYVLPAADQVWMMAVLAYLIFCILFHMNMSRQDVKNAVRGLPVCMLILFVVFLFWHINLMAKVMGLFA